MANLPGLDFAQHVINTWSAAMLKQADILNDAWGKLERAEYKFEQAMADWAKCYRLQYEAHREVGTFEVRSVEWQQVTVARSQVVYATFRSSPRLMDNSVDVTKAARLGGPDGADDGVKVGFKAVTDGTLTLKVEAQKTAKVGQQWIAFAYERHHTGPPLGVVLVQITG